MFESKPYRIIIYADIASLERRLTSNLFRIIAHRTYRVTRSFKKNSTRRRAVATFITIIHTRNANGKDQCASSNLR